MAFPHRATSLRPTHLPARLTRRTVLAGASLLALAGCSGLSMLNAVTGHSHRAREGVPYGGHARQKLDVYLPESIDAATPFVVFFYGGSWSHGERADYAFVAESLAAGGVASAIVDYRLSPQVRWRDILGDCAVATRWCFDNARSLGLSPQSVVLMGHSAGGYNAAMLALDPRWLRAAGSTREQLRGWIGIAGPYDFLPIENPEAQVAFDWPSTPPESQPIAHALAGAPRTLLLAAANDTVVNPRRNSAALADRLRGAGVPVQLQVLEGVGHVTIAGALAQPLQRLAPVRRLVLEFLGRG